MNVPDIDETTKVAPTPKPRKFKTVLCRHYATPKGCFKGDSCSFVHADPQPKELENVDGPSNPSNASLEEVKVTPALSEASPCRRFMWNGSCRLGDSCKFRHTRSDGEELQTSSTASLDEVANLLAPDKVDDDNTSPEPPDETGVATPLAGITSNQPASSTPAWWSFRTITIRSQDEQRIWTISGEELVPHSELLASILTYSSHGLNGGTDDPCKNVRGLVRRQGGQDDFQLSGVGTDDFDVFLTVLRAHPEFSFPSDDLKITLALASDWGFDDLRRRARGGLEMCNISVLDKITLARRCKDNEWIQELYVTLATRVAPLSAEEIKALGIIPTTAIARARERVLIQRLRALPFEDPYQWKCTYTPCRQALRDAWVKILTDGGSPEIPHLAVSAVLLDQMVSSGTGLCETCASDEALAKALEDWQVERTVAEAAIEQFKGEAAANQRT